MDSPTTSVPGPFRTVIAAEVETLRNHWKWFLALGIGLVVLGTISLGCSILTTEVAVVAPAQCQAGSTTEPRSSATMCSIENSRIRAPAITTGR